MSPLQACRSSGERGRRVRGWVLAFLAPSLMGCDRPPALSAGNDPSPMRQLILTTAFGTSGVPFGAVAVVQVPALPVAIPSSGRVEVLLDWTFPASNFDLIVADSACDASSLTAGRCNVLASDRSPAKPAEVSFSSSGGSITVFALQLSGPSESGVLNVWLTR